jgi:hypothetical protein
VESGEADRLAKLERSRAREREKTRKAAQFRPSVVSMLLHEWHRKTFETCERYQSDVRWALWSWLSKKTGIDRVRIDRLRRTGFYKRAVATPEERRVLARVTGIAEERWFAPDPPLHEKKLANEKIEPQRGEGS